MGKEEGTRMLGLGYRGKCFMEEQPMGSSGVGMGQASSERGVWSQAGRKGCRHSQRVFQELHQLSCQPALSYFLCILPRP